MNRSLTVIFIILFVVPMTFQAIVALVVGGTTLVNLGLQATLGTLPSLHNMVTVISALLALGLGLAGTYWVARAIWPAPEDV